MEGEIRSVSESSVADTESREVLRDGGVFGEAKTRRRRRV